jgi:hypothetical protein
LIAIGRVLDATRCVGVVASVTVMVTLLVPDAVGLPEIVPDAESIANPAGNPVAVQVYGVVPPVAATGALYETPTMPPGSDEVLIARATPIVIEKGFETIWCVGVVASVTVTVTLLVPDAAGFPEIVPVAASMAKPAGSPAADQEYGVVPPLAATPAL